MTVDGEGRREKGRWILQPSVKTQKIRIYSVPPPPFRAGTFLSWKTFDGACLAAAASLAWLQKCFPLHLSGQQTQEKKKWNARPLNGTCRTRVALYFYNQRGLACLGCSAGLQGGLGQARRGGVGGGARDSCCYNFFFLNNPTNSSICLQRKCRRSDVGRCCRPNARPAPAAVQGRDVSCIYIYIYIYLYIYAFPFPVSCQGQYVAAGTSVLSWRIQNEGPFFTVLWLGLDQKRQHLFTEVRIPEAREHVLRGEDAKEGGEQEELVTFVTHL